MDTQIEVADDVIFRFKGDTIIEVFQSEDVELDEPVEESFAKDEEIEVTIFGIDEHKYDVQFGDGTVSFIRKDLLDIVSIN